MLYLLLSIVTSTLIYLIFKLFERFQVDNFQAIVMNYFTAFAMGLLTASDKSAFATIHQQSWFVNVLIVGLAFITLFNVMLITTQKMGVSTASVASKLSVAIPVLFAFYIYKDSFSLAKALGIALALVAVYLSSRKETSENTDKKLIVLPLVLFLGSGLLDTFLKYNQQNYLAPDELGLFTSSAFIVAALLGTLYGLILYRRRKNVLQWKSIIAGIALGIPNYASIYFLLKSLSVKDMESSVVFPVNNMGIVALSAFTSFLLFREKLSAINITGIILAIVSIAIIVWGS